MGIFSEYMEAYRQSPYHSQLIKFCHRFCTNLTTNLDLDTGEGEGHLYAPCGYANGELTEDSIAI